MKAYICELIYGLHHSIFVWTCIGVVITVLLFFIESKTQVLDEKLVQNLFHLNQFTAAQNTMAELHQHKLSPSLSMLRTGYISFYAYRHDGKSPTQAEIDAIKGEADYLRLVNPELRNPSFKEFIENPAGTKKKYEYLQLLLFVGLVLSQLWVAYLAK